MTVKELIEELSKYDPEYKVEHVSGDTWDSCTTEVKCIEVKKSKKKNMYILIHDYIDEVLIIKIYLY